MSVVLSAIAEMSRFTRSQWHISPSAMRTALFAGYYAVRVTRSLCPMFTGYGILPKDVTVAVGLEANSGPGCGFGSPGGGIGSRNDK